MVELFPRHPLIGAEGKGSRASVSSTASPVQRGTRRALRMPTPRRRPPAHDRGAPTAQRRSRDHARGRRRGRRRVTRWGRVAPGGPAADAWSIRQDFPSLHNRAPKRAHRDCQVSCSALPERSAPDPALSSARARSRGARPLRHCRLLQCKDDGRDAGPLHPGFFERLPVHICADPASSRVDRASFMTIPVSAPPGGGRDWPAAAPR